MKDLIIITAHCNNRDKEEVLRGLVSDFQNVKDAFDVMVVSHTPIPDDIVNKTVYSFYDSKNELLFDWDLRSKPWFNPNNDREILSIFTGKFNTHLAVWRLFILGNGIAKMLGYKKAHHIEYDARIENFSEFFENSRLLDTLDVITYTYQRNSTVDPILFGSYQAYRLDTLDPFLSNLDEEEIKNMIRSSSVKSPEDMLYKFLSIDKKELKKSADDIFPGNKFMYSHFINTVDDAAWCLPFYDELTKRLCFIVWNMEQEHKSIHTVIVYNGEKTFSHEVKPGHWFIDDLDDYENAKELIVILNGKVKEHFKFDEYREEFKNVSFRREKTLLS
jgi:hypothetical protein